jgi:hypothetical protein
MQIARDISHIPRSLELVMAGPTNGDVATTVAKILSTQEEAARGASGTSPRLIPDVSTSIAHVLACDLVALTSRTLPTEQWVELHRRAALDLYRLGGWPDASLKRSQLAALWSSAARFSPDLPRRLRKEKWNVRRIEARRLVMAQVRSLLGTHTEALRRILPGKNTFIERRSFDHLFAAVEAMQ